jgi:hypothetical protein
LTIKADARSAIQAVEKLNTMIGTANTANIKLAGTAKSVAGHYLNMRSYLRESVDALRQMSGESRNVATAAQASSKAYADQRTALRDANTNAKKLRDTTIQTARASRVVASASGRTRTGSTSSRRVTAATPSAIPSTQEVSKFRKGLNAAFSKSAKFGRSQLNKAVKGVGGFLKDGITSALSGVSSFFTGVLKTGANAAFSFIKIGVTSAIAAGVIAGTVSLNRAVASQPIEEGFGNLVNSRELGEQTAVLGELRAAAKGTVSDLELMKNANSAVLLGAAETTDQLEFLIEGGRRLGKVMGRDATEGFNDLTIGIGRQSRLILDNLGLIVRVEEAQEKYAKSIGVTVSELGENEKKLAFQRAAYESVRSKLAELGEEQDLAVDGMGRLRSSAGNLAEKLGKAALPAITDVSNKWSQFIDGLSPEDIQSKLSAAGSAIASGSGSILDAIFGSESEAKRSVTGLGGALFEAITNPSNRAFEILEIRAKVFADVSSNLFSELWRNFQLYGEEAVYKVGRVMVEQLAGLVPFGREALESSVPERDYDKRRAFNSRRGQAEREAILTSADILIGIKNIYDRQDALTRAQENTTKAVNEATGGGSSSKGSSRTISTGTRLAAGARADAKEREAANLAKEAKKAEVEAIAATKKAREDEIAALEKQIRLIERTNSERERELSGLGKATRNIGAATVGEAASPDNLVQTINDLATELRKYPSELAAIGDEIAGIGIELADARSRLSQDLDAASKQFKDDINRRAKEFLLGGEVEGTTTRVRALQRKAKRDQRRFNKSVFQREVGSVGFSQLQGDLGGNLGGFGGQGVERSGSLLENIPRGLESALSQIINDDGSTLIAGLQEEIAAIMAEAAATMAEIRERKAEALDAQKAVQEEQSETLRAALKLEERSIKITEDLAREVTDNNARVKALEKQLNELRRQVRSVK